MISTRNKFLNTQHHLHQRRMMWLLNQNNNSVWLGSKLFCTTCNDLTTVFLDSCSSCHTKFTIEDEPKN